MPKRRQKADKTQTDVKELVIATLTDDLEEAKEHEVLLKASDIPAMVRRQKGDDGDQTEFAVMVPEEFLDEAHVVIESQGEYDDFYDLSFDDDGEIDDGFDSDLFDDEY